MMLPLPFPASTISLGYGAVDDEYYFPWSPHMGTDFSSRSQGVTAGSVIRASGAGRVVRAGVGPAGVSPNIDRPNSLAGNSVDVDYGPCIARYMHRPYGCESPSAGDAVVEGTVLGEIGNTGLSGGAHLHLETWDKRTGRRVNPANFFDFDRVVSSAAVAGDGRPFTPQEDDMYDDQAKQEAATRHDEVLRRLDEVARVAAPYRVYAWGTGHLCMNPRNGRFWILPQGYGELLSHLGYRAGDVKVLDDAQLKFATGFFPAAVGDARDGLTEADLAAVKAAISDSRVTVTQQQYDVLLARVTDAARAGGADGVKAALDGATLILKPQS